MHASFFRQWTHGIQFRNGRQLLPIIPCWLVAFLLASCTIVATLFVASEDTGPSHPLLFLTAEWLLLVRDMALIVFFNLAFGAKRADTYKILYLGAAYGVLPLFFLAMKLTPGAEIFWPSNAGNSTSLLIQLGMAVLASVLCYRRWQDCHKSQLGLNSI